MTAAATLAGAAPGFEVDWESRNGKEGLRHGSSAPGGYREGLFGQVVVARARAVRLPRGTFRLFGESRTPPRADPGVTAYPRETRSGSLP